MTSTSSIHSMNILSSEHIMLLYDNNDKRDTIVTDYLNEGLKKGYLCIYASVFIDDPNQCSIIKKLSLRIKNFEKNFNRKDLQFINFKPYYDSARNGDLSLFKQLKSELENLLEKRLSEGKENKILVVADAACHLSENKHFKESIDLETWWADTHSEWIRNNQNITVVCPHPNYIFREESQENIRNKIGDCHDITIHLKNNEYSLQYSYDLAKKQQKNKNAQIKILIVEPEPDLRNLYTEYLNGLGIEVVIVDNGDKCMENLIELKGPFDMIILDLHIHDMSGSDLVKKIREKLPDQRIVLTTTNTSTEINDIEHLIDIELDDVLLKPFTFTKLLAVIKPKITTNIN